MNSECRVLSSKLLPPAVYYLRIMLTNFEENVISHTVL